MKVAVKLFSSFLACRWPQNLEPKGCAFISQRTAGKGCHRHRELSKLQGVSFHCRARQGITRGPYLDKHALIQDQWRLVTASAMSGALNVGVNDLDFPIGQPGLVGLFNSSWQDLTCVFGPKAQLPMFLRRKPTLQSGWGNRWGIPPVCMIHRVDGEMECHERQQTQGADVIMRCSRSVKRNVIGKVEAM